MKNTLILLLFVSGSAAAQKGNFIPIVAPRSFKKIEVYDSLFLSNRTASLPVKLDANNNMTSGAINLSGSEVTGTLTVGKGGTGATATPTDGQLLVGGSGVYVATSPTFDQTSSSGIGTGSLTVILTGQLITQTVTDVDATVSGYQRLVRLSGNLTANRVLTFPSAFTTRCYTVEVWNQNASGSFSWSIDPSITVVDAAGNVISNLVNSSYSVFRSAGGVTNQWVKTN